MDGRGGGGNIFEYYPNIVVTLNREISIVIGRDKV